MQLIENEVVTGKTLVLDGKHLVNCKYTDCKVLYSGEDFAFTDSALVNCQIMLSGAAQKTANLLAFVGMVAPPNGPKPEIGNGQFGFPGKKGNIQ